MALGTTTNRIVYAGNDSTTQFAFPYYYLAKSHVKVVLVLADESEQPQSETTHYTITEPSESGGTVTMLAAPAADQKVVIYREVPLTQEFEPVEGGALPAAELEKAIDKAFMVLQQLQDAISRSIVLTPATQFSNLRIPDPEALKLLGWNSAADALANFQPGVEAQQVFSALGLSLCSQTTAAAMAGVLGGAVPVVQALAAPAAANGAKVLQVNADGDGLAYGEPTGRRNLLINGNFRFAQMRPSGSATNVAFAAPLFTPRVWNGVVYYDLAPVELQSFVIQ